MRYIAFLACYRKRGSYTVIELLKMLSKFIKPNKEFANMVVSDIHIQMTPAYLLERKPITFMNADDYASLGFIKTPDVALQTHIHPLGQLPLYALQCELAIREICFTVSELTS